MSDHHLNISLALAEKRRNDEIVSHYAFVCQAALREWADMNMKGRFRDVLNEKLAHANLV